MQANALKGYSFTGLVTAEIGACKRDLLHLGFVTCKVLSAKNILGANDTSQCTCKC